MCANKAIDTATAIYIIKVKPSKLQRWMKKLMDAGFTVPELADHFMVPHTTVERWIEGRSMAHRYAINGLVKSLRKLYKEEVRR